MVIGGASEMEKVDVKSPSLHKKNSEVGKHPGKVSVESAEKLTIRTKNGLVNGVAEEKCQSNKKHDRSNVAKEPKKTKKNHNPGVQNHDANINSNPNKTKKNSSQKSTKVETTNSKNCINVTPKEESKIEIPLSSPSDNCSDSKDVIKLNQSELKPKESSSSKSESKRRKNKSKLNKTDSNAQAEQADVNLPKFDISTLINTKVGSEKVASEAPSTSQLDASESYLPEYPPNSSEFEKTLIESIKSLKIQQQDASGSSETASASSSAEVQPEVERPAALQPTENLCDITYVQYKSELQMPMIMKIIQKDLSEPYSIYTYRYFIHNWPKLCFLAMCEDKCVGAIVCKLDFHRKSTKRGYIAMLAVDKDYRKRSIGSTLVRRAISEMITGSADEVVLETEVTNKPALRLYEQLGFVRDKRLFRYYLNGVDALRLKLWLR